ncbi:hypothetical protein [Streptomyces sp. AC602_WCS936]|uniref:hypothetical protein n=1 Tax=Streptomyces sp. AC602_WCS936 TaxID=2823685 RepID=UPI001C260A0D|nr:hypothetical protein [Streptomyces sp. AC602_WCS936]
MADPLIGLVGAPAERAHLWDALLGALVARPAARRVGHVAVIWLAPLATCPLTVLMPLAGPGWSVYVAVIGLSAPDRLLGRMSATVRFVASGGVPLGGLLGGACGSAFGASATLWIGAAGMTLSVLPTLRWWLTRAHPRRV